MGSFAVVFFLLFLALCAMGVRVAMDRRDREEENDWDRDMEWRNG